MGQLERPVCGNLSDPENGTVEIDSGFTTANYTCDEGFELVGMRFRTCMRNGNWSGSDPTCVCKSAYNYVCVTVCVCMCVCVGVHV